MVKRGLVWHHCRHSSDLPDVIVQTADSLVEGGVTALEVTLDAPHAFEMIQKLSDRYKGTAIVGAGTVLDSESARLAIDAGAAFIFSPSLHRSVIQMANRYGKIVVPGVMTPTEIITAMEWGADLVKIFPASGQGVQYVKDLKGPFAHVPMIPTGGVNLGNVSAFVQAGAAAVGVGGNLVDKALIAAVDFEAIKRNAASYVAALREVRECLDGSELPK